MREAAAEKGAEAEAEAAPRGRARGGRDHRSGNFFSCGGSREGCCRLGIDRPARGCARAVFSPCAEEPRNKGKKEENNARSQSKWN